MRIQSEMQEELNLRLTHAFLVYEDGERAVATQHEVKLDARRRGPVILPGRPADRAAFTKIAAMMNGVETRPRTLLPTNLLMSDPDLLVWYRPSERRTILFNTGQKATDKLDERFVLHPALLFLAFLQGLYVYALDSDARPHLETRLLRAPYYNIYANGHLCEGSFKLPDNCHLDGIPTFEKAFFETNFAHTHLAPNELCSHPGGHLGLWSELSVQRGAKAHKVFPIRYLIPMTEKMLKNGDEKTVMTLGGLLKQ